MAKLTWSAEGGKMQKFLSMYYSAFTRVEYAAF